MKKLIGFFLLASFALSSCKTSQVGSSGSSGSTGSGSSGEDTAIQDVFARELAEFRVLPARNTQYEDFSKIERDDPRLRTKPTGPLSTSNDISSTMNVKLSQLRNTRKQIDKMYGYRILIYSGVDATKANEYVELLEEMMTKDQYSGEQLLPTLPIIFDYTEPNYVVKIGNYLSRLDAHHQYIALDKEEFPQSIVVAEPVPFRGNSSSNSSSDIVAPSTADER